MLRDTQTAPFCIQNIHICRRELDKGQSSLRSQANVFVTGSLLGVSYQQHAARSWKLKLVDFS